MAALLRYVRPGVMRYSQVLGPSLKNLPALSYSSTSKNVGQSEYVIGKPTEVDPKKVQEIIEEGRRAYDEQNDINSPYYLTWGFDDKDNFVDLWSKRIIFFFSISLVLVLGPVYYHYLPDPKSIKWSKQEADIVLRERREAGLPLIDPEFVPRDKIILPDDVEEAH